MTLNGNTINLIHALVFLAGLATFVVLTLAGEREAGILAVGYVVTFIGGGALTQAATSTKKIDAATTAINNAVTTVETAANGQPPAGSSPSFRG